MSSYLTYCIKLLSRVYKDSNKLLVLSIKPEPQLNYLIIANLCHF